MGNGHWRNDKSLHCCMNDCRRVENEPWCWFQHARVAMFGETQVAGFPGPLGILFHLNSRWWHRETLSLSFIQVPARTPNPKRPRLIFPENPHILRAVVDEADNAVRRPAVFVPNLLEHGNLVPLLRQPEIWKIEGIFFLTWQNDCEIKFQKEQVVQFDSIWVRNRPAACAASLTLIRAFRNHCSCVFKRKVFNSSGAASDPRNSWGHRSSEGGANICRLSTDWLLQLLQNQVSTESLYFFNKDFSSSGFIPIHPRGGHNLFVKKRRDALRDAFARLWDPLSSLFRNARGELVVMSRSSPWGTVPTRDGQGNGLKCSVNGVTKISQDITRQHRMIL